MKIFLAVCNTEWYTYDDLIITDDFVAMLIVLHARFWFDTACRYSGSLK